MSPASQPGLPRWMCGQLFWCHVSQSLGTSSCCTCTRLTLLDMSSQQAYASNSSLAPTGHIRKHGLAACSSCDTYSAALNVHTTILSSLRFSDLTLVTLLLVSSCESHQSPHVLAAISLVWPVTLAQCLVCLTTSSEALVSSAPRSLNTEASSNRTLVSIDFVMLSPLPEGLITFASSFMALEAPPSELLCAFFRHCLQEHRRLHTRIAFSPKFAVSLDQPEVWCSPHSELFCRGLSQLSQAVGTYIACSSSMVYNHHV